MNLAFCSRFNFGPGAFSREMGRKRVHKLLEWAEMNTSSSVYVPFAPLGRAEIMSLLMHELGAKNMLLSYFHAILLIWEGDPTSGMDFGPAKPQIEKIRGIKVSK